MGTSQTPKVDVSSLKARLQKLAKDNPELRKHLVPLLREATEDDSPVAGREWDKGQKYGPPYQNVEYKEKPPTNRGKGKCYYETGNEADRCYVKRDIGNSRNKSEYNKKWREKVLK